jgi:hypothetical protein
MRCPFERRLEQQMETTQVAAAAAEVAHSTTPPLIGEYWPGQGGIYMGEAVEDETYPQGYLVLCKITTDKRFKWAAAIDWASAQTADGHTDFRLPTRFEAALIYANGRKHVDTGPWYWTGTRQGGSGAWIQDFVSGGQFAGRVGSSGCARAVRRFVL